MTVPLEQGLVFGRPLKASELEKVQLEACATVLLSFTVPPLLLTVLDDAAKDVILGVEAPAGAGTTKLAVVTSRAATAACLSAVMPLEIASIIDHLKSVPGRIPSARPGSSLMGRMPLSREQPTSPDHEGPRKPGVMGGTMSEPPETPVALDVTVGEAQDLRAEQLVATRS